MSYAIQGRIAAKCRTHVDGWLVPFSLATSFLFSQCPSPESVLLPWSFLPVVDHSLVRASSSLSETCNPNVLDVFPYRAWTGPDLLIDMRQHINEGLRWLEPTRANSITQGCHANSHGLP